jgi:hypothetical protein
MATTYRYLLADLLTNNHRGINAISHRGLNHNLGFYPNVMLVDSDSSIVEEEITYTNRSSRIATFSA